MKKRKKENQNPFRNFGLKRMVHYPKVCKVVARTSILFARKLTPEKDVEKEQCKLSPSGQPIRRTELLPSNIFVIGNLVMASPVNSDEILIAPVLIRRAISQQPPFILPNMHQVLTRCAAINLKKKTPPVLRLQIWKDAGEAGGLAQGLRLLVSRTICEAVNSKQLGYKRTCVKDRLSASAGSKEVHSGSHFLFLFYSLSIAGHNAIWCRLRGYD